MQMVFGLVAAIVADIPLILFRGWVATKLWFWFVVPLGLVPIGVIQATGIVWLITMLVARPLTAEAPHMYAPEMTLVAQSAARWFAHLTVTVIALISGYGFSFFL